MLALLATSGLALAIFLEWPRYCMVLGGDTFLTRREFNVVFWLLWAKSMWCGLLVLPVVGSFFLWGLDRTATVVFLVWWWFCFSWLMADVLLFGFTGAHILDYVPYIRDIIFSPGVNHAQWAGDYLLLKIWVSLVALGMIGVVVYRAMLWTATRVLSRFKPSTRKRIAVGMTSFLVFSSSAAYPTFTGVASSAVVSRLHAALPFPRSVVAFADQWTRTTMARVLGNFSHREMGFFPGPVEEAACSTQIHQTVVLENLSKDDINLEGFQILDGRGHCIPLGGMISRGGVLAVHTPVTPDFTGQLFLINPEGILMYQLKAAGEGWRQHLVISEAGKLPPERTFHLEQLLNRVKNHYLLDYISPKPVDESAYVPGTQLPDVVCIILESLNYSLSSSELLSRLNAWASQGLRMDKHFSGANCSPLGVFSLVYGRVGLAYDRVLDRKIPPQLTESLRHSGYRSSYITGGPHWGWGRMDEFLNETYFDEVLVATDFTGTAEESILKSKRTVLQKVPKVVKGGTEDPDSWPKTDRLALALAKKTLTERTGQPRFILLFLMSTHYPYPFLERFAKFQPCAPLLHPFSDQKNLINRYKNSLLCIEDALMEFIGFLDPQRTIVIITGDHGESMGEDGAYSHGTRPSEIQTRVPFFMVGPGIPSEVIRTATSHADLVPTLLHVLAGKPVSVQGCTGRDLMIPDQREDEVVITTIPPKNQILIIQGSRRILVRVAMEGSDVPQVTFEAMVEGNGLPIVDPLLQVAGVRGRSGL